MMELKSTNRLNFKRKKDMVEEMLKWKAAAKPLEDRLDLVLMAFDPNFLFHRKGDVYKRGVELPADLVIKISEILNQEKGGKER